MYFRESAITRLILTTFSCARDGPDAVRGTNIQGEIPEVEPTVETDEVPYTDDVFIAVFIVQVGAGLADSSLGGDVALLSAAVFATGAIVTQVTPMSRLSDLDA